jgi:hypothetical protein
MRLWFIFICFVTVQLGFLDCLTIYSQAQKKQKPKDEIESHKVELKKRGKHEGGDKKSNFGDDFKKYDAGEFDIKSRSTKGDEGVESYDKSSSWEKKKKKAHHKKIGDEARKSKSHKSSYHKDPDYLDDSEESQVGEEVNDKKHGHKATKEKIQHKSSTNPSNKKVNNLKSNKNHKKPKSHKKYSENQEYSKKPKKITKNHRNLKNSKDHDNHHSNEPKENLRNSKQLHHKHQGKLLYPVRGFLYIKLIHIFFID